MWKTKIKQNGNEIVFETERYDDVVLLASTVLGFQTLETSVEISCTEETELKRLEKKYKELKSENMDLLFERHKLKDELYVLKEKKQAENDLKQDVNRGAIE